jgi:hypothetical protein
MSITVPDLISPQRPLIFLQRLEFYGLYSALQANFRPFVASLKLPTPVRVLFALGRICDVSKDKLKAPMYWCLPT